MGTHLPLVHFAALGKSPFPGRGVPCNSIQTILGLSWFIQFFHPLFLFGECLSSARGHGTLCIVVIGRLESVAPEVFERCTELIQKKTRDLCTRACATSFVQDGEIITHRGLGGNIAASSTGHLTGQRILPRRTTTLSAAADSLGLLFIIMLWLQRKFQGTYLSARASRVAPTRSADFHNVELGQWGRMP
ncbi:hypothetical protein C8R44DRAFT_147721 [Mycena epipterygia]|nr:hypothetical protein C8R44DRAFT_147721 [Mycena epipterygia]